MSRKNKMSNHYKKRKKKQVLLVTILVVILALGGMGAAAYAYVSQPSVVQLKVADAAAKQEEAMPEFQVEVTCEKNPNTILDFKKMYSVQNFMKDLKSEKGYTVTCEADMATEGEYPITVALSDEWSQKISKDYYGKVKVKVVGATLTVQNKLGAWDGSKFKKWDDTYVMNDFVTTLGSTYYFDGDGNKVTGWQDIGEARYYFDGEGKMCTGWLDLEGDGKYFLLENGQQLKGWLDLDGVKYYLGDDGKLVTGEVTIDNMICTFGDDGVLQSQKSALAGNVDPNKPMMALTFDDGPGDRTMELLNVLEQYGAHATFFMLGQKVASYPDAVQKMKDIGCEIGNHSWDHANLSQLDAGGVVSEIGGTNDALAQIIGQGATVMRPPYGAMSQTLRENAGMPLILWSIDTLDWKTKSKEATVTSVMTTAGDGDIVLMHDIHSWSVDAAIECIPQLIANGYQLVTVSEMAAARGVPMANGEKYFDFY